MLNLPDEVKKRFANGGHTKNLRLVFESGRTDITNANIIAESLHFRESVSSSDSLTFGTADASILEFETIGVENLLGQWFMAYLEVDASGLDEELQTIRADLPFPVYPVSLGRFVVTACPRNHEAMTRRKFTASGRLNPIEFSVPEPLYSILKTDRQVNKYTVRNYAPHGLKIFSNHLLEYLTDTSVGLVESDQAYSSTTNVTLKAPPLSSIRPEYAGLSGDTVLYMGSDPSSAALSFIGKVPSVPSIFYSAGNSTERDPASVDYIGASGSTTITDTNEGLRLVVNEMAEALFQLDPFYSILVPRPGQTGIYDRVNYRPNREECRELIAEFARRNHISGTFLETELTCTNSSGGVIYRYTIAQSDGDKPAVVIASPVFFKATLSGWVSQTIIRARKVIGLEIRAFNGGSKWTKDLTEAGAPVAFKFYSLPESALSIPDLVIPSDDTDRDGYLSTTLPPLKDIIIGLTELRGGFLSTTRGGSAIIKTLKPETDETLAPSQYSECWFDELDAEPVGSIVYQLNDQMYTYEFGEGQSVYHFQNNDFFKNFSNISPSGVEAMFDEFLVPALQRITFTPYELSVSGHPGLEAGDRVRIELADGNAFESYVMSRDLNGIQQLTDSFTAEGQTLYDLATETEET